MKRSASKGFSLVELAIVIVIVAILAAVAIPRFSGTTKNAQLAVVKDMVSQLNSAASIYSSEQLQAPQGFDDFVTTAANTNGTKFTLSLSRFGKGTCTVAATSISCANDFPELGAVTFTTQSGAVIGNITCSTAKGGNC